MGGPSVGEPLDSTSHRRVDGSPDVTLRFSPIPCRAPCMRAPRRAWLVVGDRESFSKDSAAKGHPMYKPWPRCPKCTSPMTLTRQRSNVQGEKEPAPGPFECRSCDFTVEAVKPRPDTA